MFTYKIDNQISLKLVELRDADEIFSLIESSREYLREWLGWLDKSTKVEDTRDYIKMSQQMFAENRGMNAAILYDGKIVGIAGYNAIDWSNKIAYIGYWLGETYQGKGIMTKVAEALTEYAINQLELNRVDIRVAVENKKSWSIPERLGFVEEGLIREAEWLYDHHVDHAVYGMLAEAWKK
ncbi:GNAT family N-acetyltransferase [Metabacillus herbersteinensis]|uniref:GNAT family N-acetyltransferase n=1 Tax=Metabacillus herbersteinensis TaxID=283816 RepID=A0ABV6GA55_9BACI